MTLKTIKIIALPLAVAMVLALGSCRTQKDGASAGQQADTAAGQSSFVARAKAANERKADCITSRIKVRLQAAGHDLSLSGSLRMKRGEVVRLQLVALGLVEAARIELTPDYIMVMDRINRQYVKARYDEVNFLRESGITFTSLQALFWDELFKPGNDELKPSDYADYQAYNSGTDMAIMIDKGRLTYRWMANADDAQIKTANVSHRDSQGRTTQLTWHYGQFKPMNGGTFPTENSLSVSTPKHNVKLDFTLNAISHDTDWETTTTPTNRYKQVTVDEILRKLGSL